MNLSLIEDKLFSQFKKNFSKPTKKQLGVISSEIIVPTFDDDYLQDTLFWRIWLPLETQLKMKFE